MVAAAAAAAAAATAAVGRLGLRVKKWFEVSMNY